MIFEERRSRSRRWRTYGNTQMQVAIRATYMPDATDFILSLIDLTVIQ